MEISFFSSVPRKYTGFLQGKWLPVLLVTSLVAATSCGKDDEPEPLHEVGSWSLNGYALEDFPAGFESNEGFELDINQIRLGGVSVEGYHLTLSPDGNYERSIENILSLIEENGEWSLENGLLSLTPENGNAQNFLVKKSEDDDLWFVEENSIAASFVPDIFYDTVSQEYEAYLDTLTVAQLDSVNEALSEVLELDLLYRFERQ